MEILVDYDNVPFQIRRSGAVDLISRIVNVIAAGRPRVPEKCRVRLYGGWYEHQTMTTNASDLMVEIGDAFPNIVNWSRGENNGKTQVNVEMAKSLEVNPNRTLRYTKRRRPLDENIFSKKDLSGKCFRPDCKLIPILSFFDNKKCPEKSCYKTPYDVLVKDEQKLIDTMITADLIHLAKCGYTDLALVSSDDDLWPGIHTALAYGARILHVNTRKVNATTHQEFSRGLQGYNTTSL